MTGRVEEIEMLQSRSQYPLEVENGMCFIPTNEFFILHMTVLSEMYVQVLGVCADIRCRRCIPSLNSHYCTVK